MKKITFTSILVATLSLSACNEEKDQVYYLKNIDKATAKKSECEAKIKQAIKAKDEATLNKIKQDAECHAAHNAVREDRRIKVEQEKAAQEALEQEEIKKEKIRLTQQLGQLDWQAVAHYFVNSDCAKYGINEGGFGIPAENYICRATAQLYKEKAEQGKQILLSSPYEALRKEEKTYCNQDKRKYSACSIWEEALGIQAKSFFEQMDFAALEKQRDDYAMWGNKHPFSVKQAFEQIFKERENAIIENYTKQYGSLKQDYNQCVEQLSTIKDDLKNYQQRQAIFAYYPCSQAQKARVKLGLNDDDFKTKME